MHADRHVFVRDTIGLLRNAASAHPEMRVGLLICHEASDSDVAQSDVYHTTDDWIAGSLRRHPDAPAGPAPGSAAAIHALLRAWLTEPDRPMCEIAANAARHADQPLQTISDQRLSAALRDLAAPGPDHDGSDPDSPSGPCETGELTATRALIAALMDQGVPVPVLRAAIDQCNDALRDPACRAWAPVDDLAGALTDLIDTPD